MNARIEKLIDKISLSKLLLTYIAWIFLFGLVYWLLPIFHVPSEISSSSGAAVTGFWEAQFFSVSTATGSGFGDTSPKGLLIGFAIIELFGGVIFAGLAINLLAALPSRTTRLAAKACRGHWIEQVSIPGRGDFYSITYMVRDGDIIRKDGYNFDPQNGPMDGTRFSGALITAYFPKMISRYENDNKSPEYSEGFLEFDMKINPNGEYKTYSGMCYDKKHGRRDSIYAKRITDKKICRRLDESGELDDETHVVLVNKLFPRANISDLN